MTGRHVLLLLLFVILVVGLIGAYIVYTNRPPPTDPKFAACYAVVPVDRQAGFKFAVDSTGKGTVSLDDHYSAAKQPNSGQLDAFISCLDKIIGADNLALDGIVRNPAEPIGQVANRWAREAGLKLAILPTADRSVNLLKIGPFTGRKSDLIKLWCKENSRCVSCDPTAPDSGTTQVTVELKPEAPLRRVEMPSVSGAPWPIPAVDPTTGLPQQEPWQDVDTTGRRYFLQCTV